MTVDSIEEKSKYNKRIEEIIEDAEIEAELEAEQKIRSKHTKLVTISIVGFILLIGLFLFQKDEKSSTSDEPELAAVDAIPPLPRPAPATRENELPLPPIQETLITKKSPVPASPAPVAKKPAVSPVRKPIRNKSVPAPAGRARISRTKSPVPAAAPVLPPSRKTRPGTPAQPVTRAGKFTIQLGAFSVKDNAQSLYKKLQARGFQPEYRIRPGKSPFHVVYVGQFPDRASGELQYNDLKSAGFSPQMKKSGNGGYTFILGKLPTKTQAEALQDQLSIKGFLSSVKKSDMETRTYVVQLAGFRNAEEARTMQKRLVKKGFKSSFIRPTG